MSTNVEKTEDIEQQTDVADSRQEPPTPPVDETPPADNADVQPVAESNGARPKRTQVLTEKGAAYQKDLVFTRRKRQAESLKRVSQRLMQEMDDDLENVVRNSYKEWLILYESFIVDNDAYRLLLSEQEIQEDAAVHFDQLNIRFTTVKRVVEEYFAKLAEAKVLPQRQGPPSVSHSKKSSRSKRSQASRNSVLAEALRSKLAEDQAKAEFTVKAEALKQKRELEFQKFQIRMREEEIDLNTAIAVSSAKSKAIDNLVENELESVDDEESVEEQSVFGKAKVEPNAGIIKADVGAGVEHYGLVYDSDPRGELRLLDERVTLDYEPIAHDQQQRLHLRPPPGFRPLTDYRPLPDPNVLHDLSLPQQIYRRAGADRNVQSDNVTLRSSLEQLPKASSPIRESLQSNLNTDAEEFVPSLSLNRKVTFSDADQTTSPRNSQPQNYSNVSSSSHNSDSVQSVVRELRKPTVEIQKFSGDPLSFTRFMRQFESKILANTDIDDEKLNYLLQYTSGEAHKVVVGYSNLNATTGFYAAMRELNERYGDSEIIAHSYIKKALEWPVIKPDNGKGLDEFAVFLTECHYAAQSLDALKILEYSENMRSLVAKLPYFLHDKWRTIVYNTKARNQMVSFGQLVSFVRTESKKAIDPTYGRNNLIRTQAGSSSSTNSNSKVAQKSSSQKKSSTNSAVDVNVSKGAKGEGQSNTGNGASDVSKAGSAFSKPCVYCKGPNHSLSVCRKLSSKDIQERLDFLKSKGFCFACLCPGHMSKECKQRANCTNCNRSHPSVLHIVRKSQENSNKPDSRPSPQKVSKSTQVESCGSTGAGGAATVALSILPVRLRLAGSDAFVTTYAFLDTGSTGTFISEKLMISLNAQGRKTKIRLRTMGQERNVESHIVHGLEVLDLNGENLIALPDVYSQKNLPVSSQQVVTPQKIQQWEYLKDIPIDQLNSSSEPHEIGLLVGTNVPQLLEPWDVIRSQGNGPYAVKTLLGWVINGPLSHNHADYLAENASYSVTSCHTEIVDSKLEEMVMRQFSYDFNEKSVDDVPEMSIEDLQFMKKVEESVEYIGGHYSAKLPFKQDNTRLPNNYVQAEQRSALLKRRLNRDGVFYEQYRKYMQNIIKKDYASPVPRGLIPEEGRVWYLPHHGVFHPVKQKLRVVFDCAARFRGISLNDALFQGPNLTNSLVGVLIRFRQENIAFMADIEEMFYQVKVPPEDRGFLRFLWWEDGDIERDLIEYSLKVHLFGAKSSPSVSNFALRKTALDNRGHFNTEVVDVVLKNFYVDDCLKAKSDVHGGEKDAIALIHDIQSICSQGGFHIRQFVCNNREVMNSIPESERSKKLVDLDLDKDQLPIEHALGVKWCVQSDVFCFKIVLKERPPTRRGILSMVSSVYDPLGFLAPFVVRARCLLQELCKLGLDWDTQIPECYIDQWLKWLEELKDFSSFQVNRCLKPRDFGELHSVQLHHFSDASEVAYGVASVIRLEDTGGKVHSSLLLGKARVTPIKTVTIPRLELTAATVAVRVDNMLKRELEIPVDTSVFWTDSMAVLRYIANTTSRYHTFVANRLTVIREGSESSQWRYISSGLNPADIASRGIGAKELIGRKDWFNGPDFLLCPESEWPEQPLCMTREIVEDDPEVKRVVTGTTVVECQDSALDRLIAYHSSWFALKRAVAWILKVRKELLRRVQNKTQSAKDTVNSDKFRTRDMHDENLSFVTVSDLEEAEHVILKHVQGQAFSDELVALRKGYPNVKSTSSIRKLDPKLINGLLCVGGRLNRANLPDGFKNPIVLPKGHRVSELILSHIHVQVLHMGRNQMLSTLRQKYWLVHAPSAIRRIISKCVICRRQRSPCGEQKMADLPEDRVAPDEPPFTRVGCDYFGPFHVKQRRSIVKRYGVILTCLASRAVHIELAETLDTASYINALRRFIARRGQVRKIRSDNGTNFIGAERELKEAISNWNIAQIHDVLLQKGIDWDFNPPAGSHHGGIWERIIRSIRKVLNSVVREQNLTEECLHTLLCEVEAILNSRPLTRASDQSDDLDVLTPNHLLLLKASPSLPPGVFQQSENYSRRRWRQVQYLANLFWQRWVLEYLPLLQERQKWLQPKRNLQLGDVVLVVDNRVPRNVWPMGKIVETLPDRCGIVRQVRVKTQVGTLLRPISKLCLLLESESSL